MNKSIVAFTVFLLASEFLFAGTTLSIRERKKNLESRMKVVQEIDNAVGGWDIQKSQERIQSIDRKSEEIFREKSAKEQARILSLLEEDLHGMQKDYSLRLDDFTRELVEEFSREYFLETDWNSLADINKKEKIQRYFDMAKRERAVAQNYHRMNNPQLALLSYKRSLVYCFHAFQTTETPLPKLYHSAFEHWMKESPQFSSGKLAEGKNPMQRNEN